MNVYKMEVVIEIPPAAVENPGKGDYEYPRRSARDMHFVAEDISAALALARAWTRHGWSVFEIRNIEHVCVLDAWEARSYG